MTVLILGQNIRLFYIRYIFSIRHILANYVNQLCGGIVFYETILTINIESKYQCTFGGPLLRLW